jgi:hypothetical protein
VRVFATDQVGGLTHPLKILLVSFGTLKNFCRVESRITENLLRVVLKSKQNCFLRNGRSADISHYRQLRSSSPLILLDSPWVYTHRLK